MVRYSVAGKDFTIHDCALGLSPVTSLSGVKKNSVAGQNRTELFQGARVSGRLMLCESSMWGAHTPLCGLLSWQPESCSSLGQASRQRERVQGPNASTTAPMARNKCCKTSGREGCLGGGAGVQAAAEHRGCHVHLGGAHTVRHQLPRKVLTVLLLQ